MFGSVRNDHCETLLVAFTNPNNSLEDTIMLLCNMDAQIRPNLYSRRVLLSV